MYCFKWLLSLDYERSNLGLHKIKQVLSYSIQGVLLSTVIKLSSACVKR